MIVPSIDLERGRVVQLVGGEAPALELGDPEPFLRTFGLVGEVAVVDLDAAKGEGDNRDVIRRLCAQGRVRVGGGIRDLETAQAWLDAGATSIVLGTAATPELLRQLPPERVVVALDTKGGEVVTHGWRVGTGQDVRTRLEELRGLCGGFLVTFVDREGRLEGTDLEAAREIVEAAGSARVTIAGGITTAEEVAALDALGAEAQVGMALYTGRLGLAEAFLAPSCSDRPDGLLPTVVTDPEGVALGLVYSSAESVERALAERAGVYHSRRRGVWRKGASSGATQELLRVELDCDRDALRFTVRQQGSGFCHEGTTTCFGDARGFAGVRRHLERTLAEAAPESNTVRLVQRPELLGAKVLEEALELVEARTAAEVEHEAADLIYFLLCRLLASGTSWEAVVDVLDARRRRVSRRPCEAKPS